MPKSGIERATRPIKKYIHKTSLSNISAMENRFNPNPTGFDAFGNPIGGNFSFLSFSFNLQLLLNINIDIKIIFNPTMTKARYGKAKYGSDRYDPATLLGVMTPDDITKFLLVHLVHEFVNGTERGYKYALPLSLFMLNSEIQILDNFAQQPVWNIRVRKMEGARNWTSYLDLMFLDVNILQLDPYHVHTTSDLDFGILDIMLLDVDGAYASEALLRFSDILKSALDFMCLDDGILSLLDFIRSVGERTEREDNLTSNLVGHGLLDRLPLAGDNFIFPEVFLMFPANIAYEPVVDCMNLDYDRLESSVGFDADVMTDLVASFRTTQNVIYQQWQQMAKAPKMQTDYAIHQTFQQVRFANLMKIIGDQISSPTQITHYNAFLMEYTYKKKFNQLVDGELVIQKYKKQGLDETLLRAIAAMSLR